MGVIPFDFPPKTSLNYTVWWKPHHRRRSVFFQIMPQRETDRQTDRQSEVYLYCA